MIFKRNFKQPPQCSGAAYRCADVGKPASALSGRRNWGAGGSSSLAN